MANITELQLQGDSTVHKLNDARITTTVITNPTYILGSANANLNSIAPITVANLASVLGGMQDLGRTENIDLNLIDENSVYLVDNRQGGCSNVPAGFKSTSVLITYKALNKYSCVQTMLYTQENAGEIHYRYKWDKSWGNWINIPSFYNNYPDIASLASALGATRESQELIVDLGLPSGRKWATHNIDVTMQNGFTKSIYQYECSFFSWGNTFGVNPISSTAFSYNWGTVNDGPYASTPGASLNGNIELGYDAAFANFGNSWRLPTTEDFAELFNSSYTKYVDANGDEVTGKNKLVTVNGVVGICLMSKANGKTIFFPCAGFGNGTSWHSRSANGRYCSSSLSSDTNAFILNFGSSGVYPQRNDLNRFYGFAVRPVQ